MRQFGGNGVRRASDITVEAIGVALSNAPRRLVFLERLRTS
jgi:hypothetical protein